MGYFDPIMAMNGIMNGTSMCVAAQREMWARPKEGDAFAVHSIVDETGQNWPWYEIYVTDYRGRRYAFETLTRESQEQLCDYAMEVRY